MRAPLARRKKASRWGAFFVVALVTPVLAPPAGAQPCAAAKPDGRATSHFVFDGDTLELRDGRKLRLIGIDTPEIGRDGAKSEPYAELARGALAKLAGPGTQLELSYGVERTDKYRRLLAHAFLRDGTSIQEYMLKRGLATTLVIPPNLARAECYAAHETRARRAGVGIWSLPTFRPIAAAKLPRRLRGYRIVTGRVERIGKGGNAVWLNLEGGVALRVPESDLPLFEHYPLERLLGRRVEARGELYSRREQLRMTIHHPTSLDIID